MTFDEYWTREWKPTGQPAVFDTAMKEIAEKAWRAAGGAVHSLEPRSWALDLHIQSESMVALADTLEAMALCARQGTLLPARYAGRGDGYEHEAVVQKNDKYTA